MPQPAQGGGWESSNQPPGERAGRRRMPAGSGSPPDGNRSGRPAPADGDLDVALGELDSRILSERADILARRNDSAGERPVTSGEGPQGHGREQAGGGEETTTPGAMPSAEGRPVPRPTPARMPSLPVPPDVADARDDDVVCRQLREAAMVETDPELRDKLWDEYRRCRG